MLRHHYSGSNLNRAHSLDDLRARAANKLPNFCLEYLEGGADDELTLSRNRKVYDELVFKPRMLVDITQRDLTTQVFNQSIALPLAIAPTGFNGLLSHGGI